MFFLALLTGSPYCSFLTGNTSFLSGEVPRCLDQAAGGSEATRRGGGRTREGFLRAGEARLPFVAGDGANINFNLNGGVISHLDVFVSKFIHVYKLYFPSFRIRTLEPLVCCFEIQQTCAVSDLLIIPDRLAKNDGQKTFMCLLIGKPLHQDVLIEIVMICWSEICFSSKVVVIAKQ